MTTDTSVEVSHEDDIACLGSGRRRQRENCALAELFSLTCVG
jgi:hypothetical protein